MSIKNLIISTCIASLLAVAGLAATTTSASAYIACNHDGDCWHTDRREHVPGVTFDYHPDDYYFHRDWAGDHDHHWRGYHEGRGYWRNGLWVTL